MSLFFANAFSTTAARLLISLAAPLQLYCNQLKINEEDMVLSRSELSKNDKWNVEALYSSPAKWTEDFAKAKGGSAEPHWTELRQYQGKLSDPHSIAAYMEKYLTIDRLLAKLATYAHLRADEDLGDDEAKRNFGLISSVSHEFRLETSWMEPELLALKQTEIDRLLADPVLKPYRFALERIVRMRPHTLSADKEELLALSGKALDASYQSFAALSNADMTFASATDSSGQQHPVSNGSYLALVSSPDRQLRKSAFLNLMRGYQSNLNTLCELLQGQVNGHQFNAKARGYANCATAALYTNQIDPVVITRLIETIRKGKPAMAQYLKLRKQVLKVDELHAYDLMCPLVKDVEEKIDYPQACRLVVESVAPLGKDYQDALAQGLMKDRWVDPFETARKRSGAYSSGCYDSMPYILLNFHGMLNDVTTLAHEAGHSMHSYLSRKHQSYIYSQYPIFVAEVASTFNELLLLDLLYKQAKTKERRAHLLNDQIDRIRATIFRQTLFAEFELKIHNLVEQGQPLTPSLLNQIYGNLLRDYYGEDLVIEPELESEWARIPHFYYNFYVYQYATGLSAAMALHQQATHSIEARDRYLQFLSSGSSKYPLDLLKGAGVDMTSTAPIEAAVQRFSELVEELKRNL